MGVTSRWINPNAVPLKQDRFSDNGTFSAAKEGKYGYNKVSVGVSEDRVIGKDPDTDEDVEVREEPEPKDPYRPDEGGGGGEGGEKPPHLVETVLPSQIAVVKPPDKVRYMLGETIEYAGIGVQARLKSGQAWDGFKNGMVPFGELEFPVKKLDGNYIPESRNYTGEYVPIHRAGDPIAALKFLIDLWHEKYPEMDAGYTVSFASVLDEQVYYAHKNAGYVAKVVLESRGDENWTWSYLSEAEITFVAWAVGDSPWIDSSKSRGGYGFNQFKATIEPTSREIVFERYYGGSANIRSGYDAIYAMEYPSHAIVGLLLFYTINAYLDSPDDIPIYTATSDLDCGISQPIRFSTRGVAVCAPETEGESRHRETHFSGGCIALAPRGNAICYITASASGGSMDIVDKWIDAGSESEESETVSTDSQFTYDGRTVHYARGSVAMDGAIASYLPDTASDGAALLQHAGEIAWTMVYGNVAGTDKALPVQWARPGDGKVLETEFNISVGMPVE